MTSQEAYSTILGHVRGRKRGRKACGAGADADGGARRNAKHNISYLMLYQTLDNEDVRYSLGPYATSAQGLAVNIHNQSTGNLGST